MNGKVTFPAAELDILAEADVVVCGGGAAGIASAVASARNGAKTLLLEQSGCCGGMTSRGLLSSIICMSDGKRVLANGICREFVERIVKDMNLPGINCSWQNIHPESVKKTADAMLEEAGVQLLYDVMMTDCLMENGTIRCLKCHAPCGNFAISGKIFIDCTGDGNLSAMAGTPFEYGDRDGNVMAPTLCLRFDNVQYPDERVNGIGQKEWRNALQTHQEPLPEHHFVGFFKHGAASGAGNLGHSYNTNVLDLVSRSKSYVTGRKQAQVFLDFYRKNVPGFKKSELAGTADMMGVRESRRIIGEYKMVYEDYAAHRHFDDDIGSFSYPIDIHANDTDAKNQENVAKRLNASVYQPGENYGIPYRALLPKNTENLLVAGRCISTDRAMQSSVRVVPGCMITGEAAGTAASISVLSGKTLRQISIRDLQEKLIMQGAVIPRITQ